MKITVFVLVAFVVILAGCSWGKSTNEGTAQTMNAESTMVSNVPNEHAEEVINGVVEEDVTTGNQRGDQIEKGTREDWIEYVDDADSFSFKYPEDELVISNGAYNFLLYVEQGQLIAYSGSSGTDTPHLHWEVLTGVSSHPANGDPHNPYFCDC